VTPLRVLQRFWPFASLVRALSRRTQLRRSAPGLPHRIRYSPRLTLGAGARVVVPPDVSIATGARLSIAGSLTVRRGTQIGAPQDFQIYEGAEMSIGQNTRIEPGARILVGGRLTIGDNVYIGRDAVIVAFDEVHIADRCLFGERVSVHDENHGPPAARTAYVTAPIRVEEDVWLCAGAVITSGVTIGARTTVGANAVVTRSMPPDALAVGVPASVHQRRNPAPGGSTEQLTT
jgi:acetyltransferase-like isoleucine patch superfamily enzyme